MITPVLEATRARAELTARRQEQRAALQCRIDSLHATLPDGAVAAALQRHAEQQRVPVLPAVFGPPGTRGSGEKPGPEDFTALYAYEARALQKAQHGRSFIPETKAASFRAVQAAVASGLAGSYRACTLPASSREAHYARHLASVQRHQDGTAVVRSFMTRIPKGDAVALQRALDVTLQRQREQDDQDAQALQLSAMQRELHALDVDAREPERGVAYMRRVVQAGGTPLPEGVRTQLEAGFNADLSAVRVHTSPEADRFAKRIGAVAATSGVHIFFRAGAFTPGTRAGRELLAHEVMHVLQQTRGQVRGGGIDPDAGLEREAQEAGRRFAQADPRPVPARSAVTAALRTGARHPGAARTLAPLTPLHAIQRQPGQNAPEEPVGKRGFVREEGLNLRAEPNQRSRSLGAFPVGTPVLVVSKRGEWYHVMTGTGQVGFMLATHVHGLNAQHQAMLQSDPGLRLMRVKPGETGVQLVKRAYGVTGEQGAKDHNLWHFLNVIRKHNQPDAFGFKGHGFGDAVANFLIPGADANNVLLKANHDLWIPSFTAATRDNSVGSGTLRGEAARLGRNVEQKLKDFQGAQQYARQVLPSVFMKRLGEGAAELIEGLVTAMLAAAAVLVTTSAAGAIIGAFFGGVGAAPGAALGFQFGMWLLEWLGLGFLVAWGVSKLAQVFAALGTFVTSVWNANGDQKALQAAGLALADALAVTAVTALQILVTLGVAKGLGVATRGLANSRFGKMIGVPKLTAYLKGKLASINRTGGSTPRGAGVQEKLKSTTPAAVLERVATRKSKGSESGGAFKSTPRELEALRAGQETVQVYTTGNVPAEPGAARWKALEQPENWTPARRGLHRQLLANALRQAKAFAEAAKGGAPTIFAMRGNTAAGKSRAVRGNVPELEGPVNATPDMPHRAVNPDNFKADLYKAEPGVNLTSSQVHSESSTLASMLEAELRGMKSSRGQPASLLIDKRLASLKEVTEYASMARETGRKLNVYDVDAPLEVSLAGVLERVPGGSDPLPPFGVIAQGFSSVRGHRLDVIRYFVNHPELGKYELYGTKPNGAKVKIAEVKDGKLTIHDEALFKQATVPDKLKLDAETATTGQSRITHESIDQFVKDLPPERAKTVREVLHRWVGKTWQEALDAHSKAKVN